MQSYVCKQLLAIKELQSNEYADFFFSRRKLIEVRELGRLIASTNVEGVGNIARQKNGRA